MRVPTDAAELEALTKASGKRVFYFKADWCPDCHFISPRMPEIEAAFPEFEFVEVDRDAYMALAQEWDILGIPSYVVVKDGVETARLVNKLRKTKEEVTAFLEAAR